MLPFQYEPLPRFGGAFFRLTAGVYPTRCRGWAPQVRDLIAPVRLDRHQRLFFRILCCRLER